MVFTAVSKPFEANSTLKKEGFKDLPCKNLYKTQTRLLRGSEI